MKKICFLWTLFLLTLPGAIVAQICSSPTTTLFGLTSAGDIYPINVTNAVEGARINPAYPNPAPDQANAIGFNSITGIFYYFKINPGTGSQQFISFNPTTNTYTTLANSPILYSVHSGCVTNDGTGYYCCDVIGKLYYYSITLNTWTTITFNIRDQNNASVSAVLGSQTSGDMAIDGWGNLWILPSSNAQFGMYKISAPLPTTATATVNSTKVISPTTLTPSGSAFAGMAFTANGNVYLSTTDDRLYQLLPSLSLSFIGSFTVSGVGNDLTSCSFPMTVLPVVWQNFSAQLQTDGEVSLDWTVTLQVSNQGFGVEHSKDGKNWEDLAFVPGAGNQQDEMSYSYVDNAPFPGKNFYRIRQVDYNGSVNYSEIKTIDIQSNAAVNCWPNPAKSQIQLSSATGAMQGASVRIFDRSGRLVMQSLWQGESCTVNIGSLSPGLYVVHIQSEQGGIYNTKLLKQ